MKKKICLLSNITVDLLRKKLEKKYDVYISEGFDIWIQEVLNPDSMVYTREYDSIIVLLDGTEARSWDNAIKSSEIIELWKQAVKQLSNNITDIPMFISSIDFRENRIKAYAERVESIAHQNEWYQFLQKIVESTNNVYVLPIAESICDVGRRKFYSDKLWYMGSMPYSRVGLETVILEIERALNSVFLSRRKAIILDLDNTLWGGVIGEDGIENIELSNHGEGSRYYDFQRQLLEMQSRGVLLAISSKNNSEDVEEVFLKHQDMLLKNEMFVAKKINWDSKALNIKEIESELSLTEASFVFVDDNPVEREIVANECNEIYVPMFPNDTTQLLEFAENLYFDYFKPLRILHEDQIKTQMYLAESKRKKEYIYSMSIDEYLTKLEMKIDIHRMLPEERKRVVQLCNKTNQFNVTTIRYTETNLKTIENDPTKKIYVVYLNDKFGECGLISVIILFEYIDYVEINSFLMSCRVMGRKVENVIIDEMLNIYKGEKNYMIAKYIPTNKNVPVSNLFDRLGFEVVSEYEGVKTYRKLLTNA